jgi:hypothetical protein
MGDQSFCAIIDDVRTLVMICNAQAQEGVSIPGASKGAGERPYAYENIYQAFAMPTRHAN